MYSFIEENKKKLEKYINEIRDNSNIEPLLAEAMHYSLKDGKAIRASLLIEVVTQMIKDFDENSLFNAALAIEMIHAYSLIHDDLPAIDNDDFRRGKPTLHKKFGEDVAIVSGDALGGYAFYYLAKTDYSYETRIKLIKKLAEAAGPEGMIYGQIMDMRYPIDSIEELNKMHYLKTGRMIVLPIEFALIIAGVEEGSKKYNDFIQYGKNIGIAFQAKDDLLDVIGTEEKVGKKLNKDEAQNKRTYIHFWGVEKTQKKIDEMIDEAISFIKPYNIPSLENLANFLRVRDY